jgi:hypothetical protein
MVESSLVVLVSEAETGPASVKAASAVTSAVLVAQNAPIFKRVEKRLTRAIAAS